MENALGRGTHEPVGIGGDRFRSSRVLRAGWNFPGGSRPSHACIFRDFAYLPAVGTQGLDDLHYLPG